MFSGPRRGKRSSEEIRPHAPSVNRDYNGNIWPVSNIKKSVSGRLESSQAVNCVVGKKKILPKNMCSGGRTGMCKSWISNWSWCPPTERDMHTHTHTQNPLTVPGYCLRPTRHQPNETYLWQEHAAPALLHTGTSWILAADTHTRTYSHSGRREADGKMKTGRKDAVVSFSPLPHWVLSHLVTRRLALCPMLRPRSPHSSSFSYPAANTSLVSPSLFLPQSTRDCTPFLSLGLQVVSLSNPRESFLFPTACSSISSSLTESCSFTSCTFHLWLWPAVLCCRNSQKDIVRLGWGCTDTHTLTPGSYSALLKLRLSCPARNVLPWLEVVCTTGNSSFKFLGNSSCIT